ncbi:MAG: radical SAM protein [Spirochaetia bacterium]
MSGSGYDYLFGPVPSRRLGRSLGVDLVPHKTCTLDCIYCECGPTTVHTAERKEYVPIDAVIEELDRFLFDSPALDYITFSGSGEPTLNSGIGRAVRHIKERYPRYNLALLTNGTLLDDPELRASLSGIDFILPSLDSATEEGFAAVNRPAPDLTGPGATPSAPARRAVEGLTSFSRENPACMWLEVFIVPGINDTDKELAALIEAAAIITPKRIQLNTLDRPGTETWVRAASTDRLSALAECMEEGLRAWGADKTKVEIIARAFRSTATAGYRDDIERAVLETVRRRPCTVEDLSAVLGIPRPELKKYLASMTSRGLLEIRRFGRGIFYSARGEP